MFSAIRRGTTTALASLVRRGCVYRVKNARKFVASLRESGLSIRAIASATGTGTRQVQEALRNQVCSETTPADPAPITDPEPPVADSRFITDDQLAELSQLGNDPTATHPATGECIHCHNSIHNL